MAYEQHPRREGPESIARTYKTGPTAGTVLASIMAPQQELPRWGPPDSRTMSCIFCSSTSHLFASRRRRVDS